MAVHVGTKLYSVYKIWHNTCSASGPWIGPGSTVVMKMHNESDDDNDNTDNNSDDDDNNNNNDTIIIITKFKTYLY